MTSPTQRSLKLLREDGWEVAVVERWNHHTKIRQDLFGFADLIAMRPGATPILLQVTGSGVSTRLKKIVESDKALIALCSGFRIVIHGWRKVKVKRGGKAMVWKPRIVEVTHEDFVT